MRLHLDPDTKRTYYSWQAMKSRCYKKGDVDYARYGGRGITVCTRWRESFDAFIADVGLSPSPEHSIDRYPDNNGNYEPSNVRWATTVEQAQNRRNSLPPITHNGVTKPLTDWARECGLSPEVLKHRHEVIGMSFGDAMTTPLLRNPIFIEYQGSPILATEFAKLCGLPYYIVCNRIKAGWSVERIKNTPHRKLKKS